MEVRNETPLTTGATQCTGTPTHTAYWVLILQAAGQTLESINRVITVRRNNGEPLTAPLGAMMMHVADHGSYHRGQLATMLKQAGAPAVYTPYFRYASEQARHAP